MGESFLLYTPSRPYRRVTLEMSLKPFTDTTTATRDRVLKHLFRQWMGLCHRTQSVSIMLWVGDGSEILDYRGELDANFEWAYFLGGAQSWPHWVVTQDEARQKGIELPLSSPLRFTAPENPPPHTNLHHINHLYRSHPPRFTYRWLGEMIAACKAIGEQLLDKPVEVGLTFDPGPEFAVSDFKYRRHPEVCCSGDIFANSFMACPARLEADDVPYAGFPDGIAQGTGIGTFLGRQLQCLHRDIGFDFLWLSNGFGFGTEVWSFRGTLFDGKRFYPEKAAAQQAAILGFWRDFRSECPLIPIRTRGTNLTTGIDVASDGVPLQAIYRTVPGVEAPVNSPWAALDGNFGLELAGWLSHIAELPHPDYTYRFYIHDPWWVNSPWFDRYQRRPHDIYLPACVSRLDENGRCVPPENVSFLSVDNSYGQMPDVYAAEVSAHLLRTRELAPDALAPLLWVYPFTEYHDLGDEERLMATWAGDWFISGLINDGMPLNSVASTENFLQLYRADPNSLLSTILVVPVPSAGSALQKALLDQVRRGGKVLLYGPLEDDNEELLQALGLELAGAWEGDLTLKLDSPAQNFLREGLPEKLQHASVFSAGPLRHKHSSANASQQWAWVEREGETRALAVTTSGADWKGGALCWLRGGLSADVERSLRLLPIAQDRKKYFAVEWLGRVALHHLGVTLRSQEQASDKRVPLFTVARSRNAWVLAAYNPEACGVSLSLPHGAPLPLASQVEVRDDALHCTPPPAWFAECRIFLRQKEASKPYVQEITPHAAGVHRRWLVSGLLNASVRFYPDTEIGDNVRFLLPTDLHTNSGEELSPSLRDAPDGCFFEMENLTGQLLIIW